MWNMDFGDGSECLRQGYTFICVGEVASILEQTQGQISTKLFQTGNS